MTSHHRTAEWAKVTRINRPRIKASLPAPCVNRCQHGGIVYPGQAFDVAHIIDVDLGGTDDPSNLGPAHPRCNRSDGGKAGQQKQQTTKKQERRLLQW